VSKISATLAAFLQRLGLSFFSLQRLNLGQKSSKSKLNENFYFSLKKGFLH
jgi:hypothetical protein